MTKQSKQTSFKVSTKGIQARRLPDRKRNFDKGEIRLQCASCVSKV